MTLSGDHVITALVILAILGVVIYRSVLWIKSAPRTDDPWSRDADEAANEEGAVPLCHHCLTPQEHSGWFCPQCGATVGPYCNYMPFVYVFSEGEVLRAGVTERMRRSRLIIVGYILFSLATFAVAAPIYWFFLFRNLGRSHEPPEQVPHLTGG